MSSGWRARSWRRNAVCRAKRDAVYEDVPEPLTAEDIAETIVHAIELPRHVDLDLIVVKPVAQAASHRFHKGELMVKD